MGEQGLSGTWQSFGPPQNVIPQQRGLKLRARRVRTKGGAKTDLVATLRPCPEVTWQPVTFERRRGRRYRGIKSPFVDGKKCTATLRVRSAKGIRAVAKPITGYAPGEVQASPLRPPGALLRSAPVKVVINVDGGSRGNPGPAGIAAVVTDSAGKVLAERNETIGEATNNVAEYRALLLGIELARELGADEAEFVADSKLIVEQVRGNWKVKQDHLRPLNAEARSALRELGKWSIRHVKRDENTRADELLNAALDGAAD